MRLNTLGSALSPLGKFNLCSHLGFITLPVLQVEKENIPHEAVVRIA